LKRAELLVLLFMAGFFGFNWPFVEIFNNGVAAYLFIFWFVFIVLVGIAGSRAS
jgi:hypothetical protein